MWTYHFSYNYPLFLRVITNTSQFCALRNGAQSRVSSAPFPPWECWECPLSTPGPVTGAMVILFGVLYFFPTSCEVGIMSVWSVRKLKCIKMTHLLWNHKLVMEGRLKPTSAWGDVSEWAFSSTVFAVLLPFRLIEEAAGKKYSSRTPCQYPEEWWLGLTGIGTTSYRETMSDS